MTFFTRCFRFVTIHAFERGTDRQTDGWTDAHRKTAAAQLQRSKNGCAFRQTNAQRKTAEGANNMQQVLYLRDEYWKMLASDS